MKEQNAKVKINVGEQDGVTVRADVENGQYVVECPNSYDVNWMFRGKIAGKDYATILAAESKHIIFFAFPIDDLSSDTSMKAFNIKVNEARKISKEIKEERRDTEDSIAFDLSEPGKPVLFQYANPSKGYCTGKVLKTGKYFVATVPILPLGIENTVDKVFVRIIYSSRLIAGKEEFNNREETLQAKFPVGAEKYFAFDDKGKITVKDHKVKVVQAPVQAPVVQDAVEELAKEMTSKAMPKSKVEAKPKTTARI